MSGYDDLANTHVPATGTVAPAAWGLQIRENEEFLIDPPACSVYGSAAQSIATNTGTALTADSENYDNDSMHSTVTNTSRVTIQTAGRYLITAAVSFASNATGNRSIEFVVNGTTLPGGALLASSGSTNSTAIVLTRTLVLSAADYVEVQATQRSGGNLDTTLSEFAVLYLTR